MEQTGSKGKFIRDLLDRALELNVPEMSPEEFQRTFNMQVTADQMKKLTFAEVIARQLVIRAASGNDRSIQEVFDRLLGKPMQTTESVTKSYSYHDFLIECRKADEKENGKGVIEMEVTKALPAPTPSDLLSELLS